MALTQKHVKDVCLVNGGHLGCRYLDEDLDDNGNAVWICRKLTSDRDIIDLEVEEFLDHMKLNGQDPAKSGQPMGDNCKGYIKLNHKKQGYDVP
jgi:hypothetical protein